MSFLNISEASSLGSDPQCPQFIRMVPGADILLTELLPVR